MKILQINTVGNYGSTGRIAEQIGREVISRGHISYIACARKIRESASQIIKIGSLPGVCFNGLWQRIFDSDSPYAKFATKALIKKIESISPDIVHLHNTHGYYLHNKTLLDFLAKYGKPVVWTLHDCWVLTGHCAYFDIAGCKKWKTHCRNCPQKRAYPASLFWDNSYSNYQAKQDCILAMENLTFVPVSNWLKGLVEQSPLASKKSIVINNGIDVDTFKPEHDKPACMKNGKKNVLFVASVWGRTKGYNFVPEIAKKLGSRYQCTLVGANDKQLKELSGLGINAIKRTESASELAAYYSGADVFANPTMQEALSMVNMEAISCGTPVVCFNSGGVCETIPSDEVGKIVERGNVDAAVEQIKNFAESGKARIGQICRETAVLKFDKKFAWGKYLDLYAELNGEKF